MNFANLMFSPHGRIGRSKFWVGWLILLAGNVLAGLLPIVGSILSIALLYVGVCVYGKRLHDMGKSAWWLLLAWVPSLALTVWGVVTAWPFIMEIFTAAQEGVEPDPAIVETMMPQIAAFSLAFFGGVLIWIGFTVWVGLVKTEPAANRFGPVPSDS